MPDNKLLKAGTVMAMIVALPVVLGGGAAATLVTAAVTAYWLHELGKSSPVEEKNDSPGSDLEQGMPLAERPSTGGIQRRLDSVVAGGAMAFDAAVMLYNNPERRSVFQRVAAVEDEKPGAALSVSLPSGVVQIEKEEKEDNLVFVECLNKKSFNEVSIYEKAIPDGDNAQTGELVRYFYKGASPTLAAAGEAGNEGPALEAISAGFCGLVMPDGKVAEVHPVVDAAGQYRGTLSRELQGLQVISRNHLTETEVKAEIMDISLLEKCHNDFLSMQEKVNLLQRRLAFSEKKSKEALLRGEDASGIDETIKNYKKDIFAAENDFFKKIQKEYGIERNIFEAYEARRALAYVMVVAIVNQNADFHRNNFSKKGELFDFDMTLWRILCQYKNDPYVKVFRQPDESMFYLSVEDILRFPAISQSVAPPYWPTKADFEMSFLDETYKRLRVQAGYADNGFTAEDIRLYRSLVDDPVFIHHKYAAFLRFLLIPEELYQAICEVNLPPDEVSVRVLVNQRSMRDHYMEVLVSIPAFRDFFREHGKSVLHQFLSEHESSAILKKTGVDVASVLQNTFEAVGLIISNRESLDKAANDDQHEGMSGKRRHRDNLH